MEKFKSMTIDDMALLNQNSQTHRECDANLHAFDDLQLLRGNSNRNILNEAIDRLSLKPSLIKARDMTSVLSNYDDAKELENSPKTKVSTFKISDLQTKNGDKSKFQEFISESDFFSFIVEFLLNE